MKNAQGMHAVFAAAAVASGFGAMICVASDSIPVPAPPPSELDLAAPYPIACRVGLSEMALTMAGIQPSGANVILLRLIEEEPLRQAIAGQIVAIDQAAAEAAACSAGLASDPADQTVAACQSQAMLQLQLAGTQLQQSQEELMQQVASDLSAVQLLLLERVRGSLHHGTPAEYCVVDRSPEEWHQLRHALRAEQRAIRLGVSLDSGVAQFLAEVRSDQAVIEAKLALELSLPALVQVFEQAL